MKEISFKSGIYVIEIRDNETSVGYIKTFRKRPLGYAYEITQNISKAYRWSNYDSCNMFYRKFIVDRISIFEKTKFYKFKLKEVIVDIKVKRKIKLEQINKYKPWYKKD
jgi:hypothetical protein